MADSRKNVDGNIISKKYSILRQRWVSYPYADKLIDRMEELLEYPKSPRMPCMLIYGSSGMGKTMIAQKFLRSHQPYYNDDKTILYYPVVYALSPPLPDEDSLYNIILHSINAPVRSYGSTRGLRDIAFRVLEKVKCKMVLIDDINNLLIGTARQQGVFLNAIRYMTATLETPIVSLGINSALHAISIDDQLSNRFEANELSKWKLGNDLASFIFTLADVYEVEFDDSVNIDDLMREVLIQSDGVLGRIVKIIQTVSINAHKDKNHIITLDMVKQVHNEPPLVSMKSSQR